MITTTKISELALKINALNGKELTLLAKETNRVALGYDGFSFAQLPKEIKPYIKPHLDEFNKATKLKITSTYVGKTDSCTIRFQFDRPSSLDAAITLHFNLQKNVIDNAIIEMRLRKYAEDLDTLTNNKGEVSLCQYNSKKLYDSGLADDIKDTINLNEEYTYQSHYYKLCMVLVANINKGIDAAMKLVGQFYDDVKTKPKRDTILNELKSSLPRLKELCQESIKSFNPTNETEEVLQIACENYIETGDLDGNFGGVLYILQQMKGDIYERTQERLLEAQNQINDLYNS